MKNKIIALYDHHCILCQKSKQWFMSLDWFHQIEWISLQKMEEENTLPFGITGKDLRRELHVLTKEQTLFVGFYAIRKIFLQFPLTYIVGLVLYLPFADKIGVPLYRIIAKNRYRFFRKKCKDGNCSL